MSLLLSAHITPAEVKAQAHIRLRVNGAPVDTFWLGKTWGKRAIPFVQAPRSAEGWAELKTDSLLPDGVYAVMFKKGRFARYTFLSLLLSGNQRAFSIETSADHPYAKARLTGAPPAEAYIRYYEGFQSRLRLRDSLNDIWRLSEAEADFNTLTQAEKELYEYQTDFRKSHRGTLLDTIIGWTMLPDPASWLRTELPLATRRQAREKAYIVSTLEAVAAPDVPRRMTCPLWIDRLDLAVFKLHNNPAETRRFVDTLLRTLSRHEEAYQYYFTYTINSFSGMSRFSLDEVFLHLYENYVKPGRAPWLEEDNRNKLAGNASGLPGTLIGDKARNAPVEDRQGRRFPLDSLLGKQPTLLVFWDPECGHCQKELPELKSVCAPYLAKGLRVVTVCMAKGPRAGDCWSFTDSRQLPPEWFYLREPDGSSALVKQYNLRSFPRLYLIDRNKKIVYRRSGEVPAYEMDIMLRRFTGG
jgi:thiol-disulfide isomerase/thioredoxin